MSLWSGVGPVRSSPGRRLGAGMRCTDMALTGFESTAFRLRAFNPEVRSCGVKQLARLEEVRSLSSWVGTGVDRRREELLACAWKHRGAVPPHPTLMFSHSGAGQQGMGLCPLWETGAWLSVR